MVAKTPGGMILTGACRIERWPPSNPSRLRASHSSVCPYKLPYIIVHMYKLLRTIMLLLAVFDRRHAFNLSGTTGQVLIASSVNHVRPCHLEPPALSCHAFFCGGGVDLSALTAAAPALPEAGAVEAARDFFIPAPSTGLGRFTRWSLRRSPANRLILIEWYFI